MVHLANGGSLSNGLIHFACGSSSLGGAVPTVSSCIPVSSFNDIGHVHLRRTRTGRIMNRRVWICVVRSSRVSLALSV